MPINNNGDEFEVIKHVSSKEVHVRFKKTGAIVKATATNVRCGRVKDKFAPTVYDVGCIGYGEYNSKHKAYHIWKEMIGRCYEPTHTKYPEYGAKGVTVHYEWHNYQNFAAWYEPQWFKGCQVDKDLKAGTSKQYGPDNCLLLSAKDNSAVSNSRSYMLLDPSGRAWEITNLTDFAKEHGVNYHTLYDVASGRKQSAKGWTKL